MNVTETRRYEMLVRVRNFGEAHRAQFPESSVGGQAFAGVAAAVAQLSQHASKVSKERTRGRKKLVGREALIEHLETIGRTARAIAADVPGFDDPFGLPRRHTNQTLLTTGRVFVQDAEAHKDRFIAHGMPETFVAELTALVDTFEESVRARDEGRSAQASAQAGIASALLSGLAAVQKLDVIVRNQFRHDPVTLAGWEEDRRLNYPRRSKRALPASEPAAVSPGPAPIAAPAAITAPAAPVTPAAAESAKPSEPGVAMKVAS